MADLAKQLSSAFTTQQRGLEQTKLQASLIAALIAKDQYER